MTTVAEKSSTGLDANVAAALTYIPVVNVVFLVIEKGSRFVKFHAVQSLLLMAALFVAHVTLSIVTVVLGFVPILGWIASFGLFFVWIALTIGGFVVWLIAVMKAFQGEWWKMPTIGAVAEKQSANL